MFPEEGRKRCWQLRSYFSAREIVENSHVPVILCAESAIWQLFRYASRIFSDC